MAHNTNKKSQGLCQKIHSAVSPLRSRIRRLSYQPQGSISMTNDGKPAHVLQQSSLSKMIPVEFNHLSAENTKLVALPSPLVQPVKVEKGAPTEGKQPSNHAQFTKVSSKKDDHLVHDGKFSDYISKVKNRMMKTASNVGGGGGHVEKTFSLK